MNQKDNTNPPIKEVIGEKNETVKKEKYNEYVKNMTPKSSCFCNCLKAFFVGGVICTIGQGFMEWYRYLGNDEKLSALYTTISLILLSVLLTGFNLYQKLGQFGGAGSVVPITGFANSVVSPAIEFQAEGDVFGVGCKIFTISGPVILFGVFSSWVLGLIYWGLKCFQII